MFRCLKFGACVGAIVLGISSAGALAQEATVADSWQGVEPQVLTDQQFQDVLSVMEAMAKGKITIEVPDGATVPEQLSAVEKNPAALQVLSDHGYTPETYHPILVNATIALSMADVEAQMQQVQGAIEALEGQKDAMAAEQYDQALAELTAQLSFLDSVPPENLALGAKHLSVFAEAASAAK